MEAANPVKAGRVKFDASANERREYAIGRNVLAPVSPVAVLVMGGNRNLCDDVKQISGPVEYLRVQVTGHWKAVGE